LKHQTNDIFVLPHRVSAVHVSRISGMEVPNASERTMVQRRCVGAKQYTFLFNLRTFLTFLTHHSPRFAPTLSVKMTVRQRKSFAAKQAQPACFLTRSTGSSQAPTTLPPPTTFRTRVPTALNTMPPPGVLLRKGRSNRIVEATGWTIIEILFIVVWFVLHALPSGVKFVLRGQEVEDYYVDKDNQQGLRDKQDRKERLWYARVEYRK